MKAALPTSRGGRGDKIEFWSIRKPTARALSRSGCSSRCSVISLTPLACLIHTSVQPGAARNLRSEATDSVSLWSLPGPFQNNVEPCAELADLALPLSCPCPLRSSPPPLPDEAPAAACAPALCERACRGRSGCQLTPEYTALSHFLAELQCCILAVWP